MEAKYYVGVDLHKRSYHFCILNQQGDVVRRGNDRCDESGVLGIIRHLNPNHHIVVEPVANVYWFMDKIKRYSGPIHLAHPLKVRLIAQSRTKSDSYDARTLADLLRVGYLPEAYVASPEIQDLRSLIGHRSQLVKDRTRTKNRITFQFTRHSILFKRTDPFGKRGRQQMTEANIPVVTRFRVNELLETLDRLVEKIKEADNQIKLMTKDDPVIPLLQTIPGIALINAATIRAVTGEIERFSNVKAFASFTGLIPASRQSGDHSPSSGITHQGSKAIRTALVQAAPTFMYRDPASKKLHVRLCMKGSAKKARIAVAHRIARIVYNVWKKRRPFWHDIEDKTN